MVVLALLLAAALQAHCALAIHNIGRLRWLYGRAHPARHRAVILLGPVLGTFGATLVAVAVAPTLEGSGAIFQPLVRSPILIGLVLGAMLSAVAMDVYLARIAEGAPAAPPEIDAPADS